MSRPIAACAVRRAIDDPDFKPLFFETMRSNIKGGSFSLYGCTCEPPCKEPEDEELDRLTDDYILWEQGQQ